MSDGYLIGNAITQQNWILEAQTKQHAQEHFDEGMLKPILSDDTRREEYMQVEVTLVNGEKYSFGCHESVSFTGGVVEVTMRNPLYRPDCEDYLDEIQVTRFPVAAIVSVSTFVLRPCAPRK